MHNDHGERAPPMLNPPHLGELVRESMDEAGWSITKTAGHLGCGRGTLSRLLSGKSGISANMALALEDIGWGTAEHWMRMRASYDLAQACRKRPPERGTPARNLRPPLSTDNATRPAKKTLAGPPARPSASRPEANRRVAGRRSGAGDVREKPGHAGPGAGARNRAGMGYVSTGCILAEESFQELESL